MAIDRAAQKRAGGNGTPPEPADATPIMGWRRVGPSDPEEAAVAYTPAQRFDPLNQKILALLQEDGRIPFSSVAQTLGVSEATVRTRVGQLRQANLIHFITVVNPLALGYTAWAMLGITVAAGASANTVSEYFRDRPEVVYVMRVASRYDLLAEVVCRTPDELRDFLDVHCHRPADIASVEPMVGLGLYKSLLKWDRPISQAGGPKTRGRGAGKPPAERRS